MTTRPPAVAGTFYPAKAEDLLGAITGHLEESTYSDLPLAVRILIVPHAGYVYSGLTAAYAYRCLADLRVDRIVMLGPSHYVPFTGLALPEDQYMETPLGSVAIDAEAVRSLLRNSLVTMSGAAHRREHSLEVQLPFIQTVAPGASVVPLLTGAIAPAEAADIVGPLLDDMTVLLVSSDLSHYYDSATARRLDTETAEAIAHLDGDALGRESACGRTAIQIALELASRAGYDVATLDLRNSGDTAGPTDRVVGYGAFALGVPVGG